MARQFTLVRAYLQRESHGYFPRHEAIVVHVRSEHLKSRPLDLVELTENEALQLAAQLTTAVLHKRGVRP